MKGKISILSVILIGWTSVLLADDSNKQGIDYFKAAMYNYAKKALLDNIEGGKADKAEAYYYLGEIYAAENMKDSADYYYKQGLAADPNYVFNSIGELKLNLANNPGADKAFEGFRSGKNKKNPSVYVAIARAYRPVSMTKAREYLEKAKLINSKSPEVYVLEGDILAAENKIGDAANSYEQAIYFDNNCKEAYLKYARIYKRPNPQLAIDMMNKLLSIDPSYTTAYRDLAEVYYENNRFKEAAEAYSKYINPETSDMDDLARYATILYLSGDHATAQNIVSRVMSRAPENAVMQRLNMYMSFDKQDFPESLARAEKMMQTTDTTNLISRDYIYYARILAANKKKNEAVNAFKKAIYKDTSRVELYKELADMAKKEGLYDDAIEAQTIFIDKAGKPEDEVDNYYNLGLLNYTAARDLVPSGGAAMAEADSIKMVGYIHVADSLFKRVSEKVSDADSWRVNLARGRNIWLLDMQAAQGLAKPYYEAAIASMESGEKKNPKSLSEAYFYMVAYNIAQENYPEALNYVEKTLAVDPDHAQAKSLQEQLKKALNQ